MRTKWTKQEDADLLECVKIAKESGEGIGAGLNAYADMNKEGRTARAVFQRYAKLRNMPAKEEVKEVKEVDYLTRQTPQPKVVSTPETVDDFLEKIAKEFDKLKRENLRLKDELETLREENEQFVKAFQLARKAFANTPDELAYTVENGLIVRRDK